MTQYERLVQKKELAERKARRAVDEETKNFFLKVILFCENKLRNMSLEEACKIVV